MKTKEFAKLAIKNGYTNEKCEGWDWIRENLSELDDVFQSKKYKEQKGMKYKCMPFLLKENLSELEKEALTTAWYLNNDRIHIQEKKEKIEKYNAKGFYEIENDEKYDGKQIEFIIDSLDEIMGGIHFYKGRLKWSTTDKRLMAMEKRHTRRGYWVDSRSIYIKIIN